MNKIPVKFRVKPNLLLQTSALRYCTSAPYATRHVIIFTKFSILFSWKHHEVVAIQLQAATVSQMVSEQGERVMIIIYIIIYVS